ncbi:MAG: amidohydrolase family protein [Alphaproteobacteria bacterium]|nr:amidohydrolase family protein [Alphaproteobacteria bacterium]
MGAIDSDAHVLETTKTWEYLEGDDKRYTPYIVTQTHGPELKANDGTNTQHNYWLIGNRPMGKDRNVGTEMSRAIAEMEDIPGRLAHMDELGIETQVLYPTLYLRPVTDDINADLALTRAYNRWVADVSKQANGRMRWIALPPMRSPNLIRDEMKFAKDNGACGIFLRGLECDRAIGDPTFYPLWEIASDLDMPICMHSGNGSVFHHDFFESDTSFTKFKLAVVGAFHTLIEKQIPAKFPDIRWGFIEVSAQWVPYVLCDLEDRFRRNGWDWFENPLKENNMYVACENTDHLDYIVKYAGEDNLVIGTDYGHHDPSSEVMAVKLLREDDRLAPGVADKILDDNARALYGLN